MRQLEKIFLETVARESMLPIGCSITAAVSGGADSVAMLYLLSRFAVARKWDLSVLHINHGLREESQRDEAFVKSLSEEFGLSFSCRRPVPGTEGSMESRWSSLRQDVFNEQPGIVTVAHTSSDRAETLLMRLFEGSGLRGLGGMDYSGTGSVRRPMLDMHKSEIRNWLVTNGIEWVEDKSNEDLDINRNRLRLQVMPVLESNFPEAVSGITRSGAILSRWRDLQEEISLISESNNLPIAELLEMPSVLASLTLWNLAGKPRNGFEEFNKILCWLNRGGRGKHILPGGKRLIAEGDLILVKDRGSERY